MRLALRLSGTALILASALGLIALGVVLVIPTEGPGWPWFQSTTPTHLRTSPSDLGPVGQASTGSLQVLGNQRVTSELADAHAQIGSGAQLPVVAQTAAEALPGPITHLEIAAIDLSADVVPAALVQRDGGFTWEVPAFKVGHAESTAAAGQPGNVVLLGHVTSLHSGNVFANLDRVQVGQTIALWTDSQQFTYTVVSTESAPRTDPGLVAPSTTPVLSLITCTGVWLPTIWDYTERLVVRAELDRSVEPR